MRFRGCRSRPCASVAVVKSSGMVVVCLSEPLMRRMSSANLRLERFVLVFVLAKSDSLVHFSDVMRYCESVNKSVLSGSPCLVPRSR